MAQAPGRLDHWWDCKLLSSPGPRLFPRVSHLAWLWLGLHIQICDSLHEDVVAQLLLLQNKPRQTLRVWNNYLILLVDSMGFSDWPEGEGFLGPRWGDAHVQDLPSHVWPAPGGGRTLRGTTNLDICLWPLKVLGFLPAWQPCSQRASQQIWVEAHAFLLSSLMVTEHHFCCSRQSRLLKFEGKEHRADHSVGGFSRLRYKKVDDFKEGNPCL